MGIYNIVDDEPAPVIEWAASAGDHDRREAPSPTCQHGRAASLPVESSWTLMVKPRCPRLSSALSLRVPGLGDAVLRGGSRSCRRRA